MSLGIKILLIVIRIVIIDGILIQADDFNKLNLRLDLGSWSRVGAEVKALPRN